MKRGQACCGASAPFGPGCAPQKIVQLDEVYGHRDVRGLQGRENKQLRAPFCYRFSSASGSAGCCPTGGAGKERARTPQLQDQAVLNATSQPSSPLLVRSWRLFSRSINKISPIFFFVTYRQFSSILAFLSHPLQQLPNFHLCL